ncbi:di-trans,poly-cis-decaprenylcistransferase [Patescibacteria group bacterium]|jgi:undecaprenyl diphosphate synthase|nr:di-trans,poly-cis-decaprenylcistransferase [Patescibacteria group bacterium]
MTPALNHLAIIMDGNRRWAKERGMPSLEGHRAGYERMKEVGDWCLDRGIQTLSVFAFSTENWNRAEEEVGYLMDLLEKALTNELQHFAGKGVRMKVVGSRDRLRPSILRAIEAAEKNTAENTKATFAICLNYGGRPEILNVCKKMIADGLKPEEVTEAEFAKRLYWPDMPDPDLIVRTSGEERLSGFLTWEGVYSELYFTNKHWPDFDEEELDKALEEYASRQRRFGK